MSTRLTVEMKDGIVFHLLNHRFAKERQALKDRDNELALSVYRAGYSAKVRQQMDELPEGWLPVTSGLRFTIGNMQYSVGLINVVRIPACDQHQSVAKFKEGHAIAEKYKQIANDRGALRDSERECKAQAKNALAQFSTVASLLKGWPEVEPFLAKVGVTGKTEKLPAVVPAELNKKLALPVGSKRA